MTIYRGVGGGGDATSDIELNAITELTASAGASAVSAGLSADAAATSAASASGYLATTAASAAAAASSATSAGSYAGIATTQAGNAATSASTASTQASLATTQATNAANSATAAASSASSASTSATAAASSASSAATSASNASASASSASTSATTATTQASNASSSASAAATSAANAATSETNAAASVIASASSASSSSISASSAASSAAASSTSAASAASSAASATAIVLGTASTRASIRPSLLLDFASTRVLDPRVTFTRASTATFYDKHTSAVAEQNLLIYSQDYSQTAWTKTAVTNTANSTTAPDGTATASTITADGTAANHFITQANAASATGKTFSVYLKAGTNNYAQISFTSSSVAWANFDLSAGTVGSTGSTQTASIVSVGNGWYRCIVSSSSAVIANPRISIVSSSTAVVSESNSLTTDIYMWGAQAELRSFAAVYALTTTAAITNYIPVLQTAASGVARFDCNPVTRESLGLLIEEARTNLLTYSSEFDNAAWTKSAATITSNIVISPDGLLSGDKIIPDATTAVHRTFLSSLGAAGAYTASCFMKAGEYTWGIIRIEGINTFFNLSTGVLGTVGAGVTATITNIGNGWYRCNVTKTLSAATIVTFGVGSADNVDTFAGDGYSGIFIWGAQLEAGSFATSYIPTVASQVTRATENFSMSGTNFSSWYNQAEGTISVTAINKGVVSDSTLYAIDDGTTGQTNTIDVRYTTFGTILRSRSRANSVSDVDIQSSLFTFGTQQQFSFGYKVNDFAASHTGGAPITDVLGALPQGPMAQLRLGARGTGGPVTQLYVSRFAYYPERLSNTELQGITA